MSLIFLFIYLCFSYELLQQSTHYNKEPKLYQFESRRHTPRYKYQWPGKWLLNTWFHPTEKGYLRSHCMMSFHLHSSMVNLLYCTGWCCSLNELSAPKWKKKKKIINPSLPKHFWPLTCVIVYLVSIAVVLFFCIHLSFLHHLLFPHLLPSSFKCYNHVILKKQPIKN